MDRTLYIDAANDIIKLLIDKPEAPGDIMVQEILDQLRTDGKLNSSEYQTLWESYLPEEE